MLPPVLTQHVHDVAFDSACQFHFLQAFGKVSTKELDQQCKDVVDNAIQTLMHVEDMHGIDDKIRKLRRIILQHDKRGTFANYFLKNYIGDKQIPAVQAAPDKWIQVWWWCNRCYMTMMVTYMVIVCCAGFPCSFAVRNHNQ